MIVAYTTLLLYSTLILVCLIIVVDIIVRKYKNDNINIPYRFIEGHDDYTIYQDKKNGLYTAFDEKERQLNSETTLKQIKVEIEKELQLKHRTTIEQVEIELEELLKEHE